MNATILLVEDNPKIMDMNRQALTMHGYRVLEAETIEAGRALVEKESPDLIILDILLPEEMTTFLNLTALMCCLSV